MSPSTPESEDRLIAWLRRQDPDLRESIGDDAAFLPPEREGRAVTMDSQIEGVHFVPGLPPEVLARRLLAVNLSDLAAVGARPDSAFLALAAPTAFDRRRFFSAFLESCREFGVRLSGGDLATSDRIALTLTLLGKPFSERGWLRRDRGRRGHSLWLGEGELGKSAVGRILLSDGARLSTRDGKTALVLPRRLRIPIHLKETAFRAIEKHLLPKPQLKLGRWLASLRLPVAAIDLSDGFAKDLRRLCKASGVGARIDRTALKMAPALRELSICIGREPEALSLGGGEDYLLLFSLPEEVAAPEPKGCRRVGELTPEPEILWGGGRSWEEVPDLGWDHLEGKDR